MWKLSWCIYISVKLELWLKFVIGAYDFLCLWIFLQFDKFFDIVEDSHIKKLMACHGMTVCTAVCMWYF